VKPEQTPHPYRQAVLADAEQATRAKAAERRGGNGDDSDFASASDVLASIVADLTPEAPHSQKNSTSA